MELQPGQGWGAQGCQGRAGGRAVPISTCRMGQSGRALQGFAPGAWLRVLPCAAAWPEHPRAGQDWARRAVSRNEGRKGWSEAGISSGRSREAGISSGRSRGAGRWLLCKDEARAGWQKPPCALPPARVPVGSRLWQQQPPHPCLLPEPGATSSAVGILGLALGAPAGRIRLQAQSIPIPLRGNFISLLLNTELLLLLQRWVMQPWVTPVPWVPSSATATSPGLSGCAGGAGWPFPSLGTRTLHLPAEISCWMLVAWQPQA